MTPANDTEYGLSCGVITESATRCMLFDGFVAHRRVAVAFEVATFE